MRRLHAAGLLACGLAGCAPGPSYHRPDLGVPAEWRPPPAVAESLRPFYDSLRAFRDTLPLNPGVPVAMSDSTAAHGRPILLPDTAFSLAWFDLLVDPALRQLVEISLRENRDLRVALATIDQFRGQYGSTRGAFFPQISLNANVATNQEAFGSIGTFRFNQFSPTANLSWELDVFGRIRRATDAARNDLLAQEDNQRAVVLALVSNVATSYLQLRQLDLELEISRRTLATNRETLRLARRRFDVGQISELDVRQFESNVATPAATVAQLEGQITQQEDQLSVLLGRYPGDIPRGRPLPEVLGALKVPAYVPKTLLKRRPDLQRAEAQLRAATARIGVAEGNRLPVISVTASYGSFSQNTGSLFTSSTEIYQVLGAISVPIYTGGSLGKQVDVARAIAEQARFTYEKTVLTAVQEVQDAIAGVRAARNQAAAQQVGVDALRRSVTLADRRYREGIASYLDLLNAQQSLFTAELTLAQVQGQEAAAAVTLYRALGGGWPASVADTTAPPQR
jgi:outer membrane protein, multidrug efflux system